MNINIRFGLKRAIKKVIYFIIFSIIFMLAEKYILFIPKVLADTYIASDIKVQFYDNSSGSLSRVTTDFTNNTWRAEIPRMVANSAGGAVGISTNTSLLKDHTYTTTLCLTGNYGGNLVLSSYNRVGIGTNFNDSEDSYENNNGATLLYSNNSSRIGMSCVQLSFKAKRNGNIVTIPFATSYTGDYQQFIIDKFTIDDLGTSGVSQQDINNSLNNQTNIIENNINASTNTIIQNQNENNNKLDNSIKDGLQNCRKYKLIYNSYIPNVFINYDENFGYIETAENKRVVVYEVPVINQEYQFIFKSIDRLRIAESNTLYNSSTTNSLGFLYATNSPVTNETYSVKPTKKYLYFYLSNVDNSNGEIEPLEKDICTSKIDDTNSKLDNLDGTIKDDDIDDPKGKFDEFNSMLADEGVITQLFTLPVSLYQNILNGLNGTCKSFTLGNLLGTDLSLPCINLEKYLGSFLFHTIDLILSGLSIYLIARKFIHIFDNLSELRGGDVL